MKKIKYYFLFSKILEHTHTRGRTGFWAFLSFIRLLHHAHYLQHDNFDASFIYSEKPLAFMSVTNLFFTHHGNLY